MTITQLKKWMREQLEQGNSIAVVTAGQGGAGYATTDNEAIIADVDRFDSCEVVNNSNELEQLGNELAGNDELSNYDTIIKLSNTEGEVLYILTDITSEQLLEQALIDYAINEASHEDVAKVLNVDADDIQGALVDFAEEWNEADEPSDADEVIDKWVEFFTCDDQPTDVELTKHNNGSDYLEWTWRGKHYWEQGEFHVDADNNLHNTFYAPNGKAIEIVTPYE